MHISKVDKIKLNFIIGSGRSGTTLLVLLLNQNPHCLSTPEVKHFLFFYEKYKDVKVVTQQLLDDYLAFFKLINESRNLPIFTESSRSFFLDAVKPGDEITYARLTKLLYLSYFEEKSDVDQITCIVDKNPFYTFHTDKILKIFPDAGFIVMVRDYRANVLSNRQSQKPFIKVKSVFYYAYSWNYHAERVIDLCNTHKDQVLIVKYEEMVSRKEEQIVRIFEFLGLTYSEAVFDSYYKIMQKRLELGADKAEYERSLKKISDLSKPVNMDRVSAWKTNFTKDEIRKVEYVSAKYGKFFGYEPVEKQKPFAGVLYALLGFPGFMRVALFYALNSIKIHHYLNVVRKAKHRKKRLQKSKNQ